MKSRDVVAFGCPFCFHVIGRGPANLLAGTYVMHVIDEHWTLVQQIHETTGNKAARAALVVEMMAGQQARRNTN